MSGHQKFRQQLCKVPTPTDIRWTDLESFLKHLGFKMTKGDGSRRKFFHAGKNLLISLHKPHPESTVARCYIAYVVENLESNGFLED